LFSIIREVPQNYNNYFRASRETEYVDWKKAKRVTLANLKPSVKTISLRLPESMLEKLKLLANKRDVPYQSLVKVFLADRIEEELTGKTGHGKASHRTTRKQGSR